MVMAKSKRRQQKRFDEDLIKKAARLLKGETLTKEEKESYKLHERVKKKYERLRISVGKKNDQWAIDLAEMNDLARYNYGYRYWLVCIDIYSRYVFVKMLKNKTSKNVGEKFEQILKESEEIPSKIQCDEGTEFQRIRHELSRKYSFEVFSTYNREIKASHAERVIQTLKTMVRRVLTVLSSNSSKEERNYTGFLPLIVQRYNESPHRGLRGLRPIDVFFGTKKISLKHRLLDEINKNPRVTKEILKIGTVVRIARAKNSVFEKSSLQAWVKEKFKIHKVFLTNPITYSLIDFKGEVIEGKFYREELQKI